MQSGPRFIFITGGVISSLGKGIAASALGALLKTRGFSVRLRKLDPYLNVDPGTMSPYQHGEVYVTEDGCETDMDLGHYERFAGVFTTRFDYTTAGQIYQFVLQSERKGQYLGATVQTIPHITERIKNFITTNCTSDFLIAEIGGTVGDIEGYPFLEAVRQIKHEMPSRVCCVHMGWVPYVETAGEYKTKPMQHSVKELQRAGIQPDLLLLRASGNLPKSILDKIGLFTNVRPTHVHIAQDQSSLYSVPRAYSREGFDQSVVDYFGLKSDSPCLDDWQDIEKREKSLISRGVFGIVAKYGDFRDAYRSLLEALNHAYLKEGFQPKIRWIDPESIEGDVESALRDLNGILVPGSFGVRGCTGILSAIGAARIQKIPFLGICAGMQFAVIEAMRTLPDFKEAHSQEFTSQGPLVVRQMQAWEKDGSLEERSADDDLGGSMRLGSYPCVLKKGSRILDIYGIENINERHRHRFEVDSAFVPDLERAGLFCSGASPCGHLPEVVERNDHPFFVGVQFHPEFKSSPRSPHPLFCAFVRHIVKHAQEERKDNVVVC